MHGGQWTQAARGVARQANVRLCLEFSFAYYAPVVGGILE